MDSGARKLFVDTRKRGGEDAGKEHVAVLVGGAGDVGAVEELVAVFLNEAFDESPLEEVFIDVEARIDVLCIDLNHASTLGSIGLSGPCKLDF